MPNLTRRAALALIAGGSGILIYDTAGFAQINAERETSVNTASDKNALLGLDDESDGATISGPNDTAAVYEITDGSLPVQSDEITVLKLIEENGTETPNPSVKATVSETQPSVDISCTSDTDSFGSSYKVALEFDVEADGVSVNATRTTNSYIDITCTQNYNYGDPDNYRDDDGGNAAYPVTPTGSIKNPSAVNKKGETAIAKSDGGQDDLKIGFSLPPVDSSASTYEMRFVIESMKNSNSGSFGFYLVNSEGDQLIDRQILTKNNTTYEFTETEADQIAPYSDELYLIIDSDFPGKGNKTLEIDSFSLNAS